MLILSIRKYSGQLVLLLAGVLLIAAISCGGSDGDDDSAAAATSTTSAPTATAKPAATATPSIKPGTNPISATATAAPVATKADVAEPESLKRGGVLKYGADPNNNHVFFQQYTPGAGSFWAMTVGDPLMAYGADSEWLKEKSMAVSFDVSSDGQTLTFKLREGVKMHDGTDYNAAVQKFSLDWVLDPDNTAVTRPQIATIDKVTVIDEFTIELHNSRVYTPILSALGMMGGMPFSPTAWEEQGADGFKQNGAPSNGPFRVKEWIQGTRTTFEAHPDYWNEGKPYLDGWIWEEIGDSQVRGAALTTGAIDLAEIPPSDTDTVAALRAGDAHPFVNFAGVRLSHHNAARAPFDDKRVRIAAQMALDRQAWNDVLLGGEGHTYMGSVLPPTSGFAFEVDEYPYEYNPEKARELLEEYAAEKGLTLPLTTMSAFTCSTAQAEAGCIDLVEQPISIVTTSSAADVKRAEFEAAYFNAVGFEVTMDLGSGNEAPRTFVSKDASFSLRGFGVRPHPSGSFDSYMGVGGYWNNGGWSTAPKQLELQAILEAAAATYDYSEQVQLYKDAQELYMLEALGGVKSANNPTFWFSNSNVKWEGWPNDKAVMFPSDSSMKVYNMWLDN
jgi:ABC-type transport system substrate-binding protein